MGGAAKGASAGTLVGGAATGGSFGATADIAGLGKNSPGGFLGTIGNMAGAGSGAGGTGFAGPSMGNLQQATTVKDVNAAEKAVGNNALAQKNLLAALQGQNALNIQSGVMDQQQSLANQLQQANGVGTQNAAIQGLQNTAGMYGNIASGQGPNPAMAMLNQQTGANIANQSAMMAGQRGASANAGLIARQAAQQGGALQQNAVGQGATMQANQQLNALQGLANTQQAFGNMGGAQVGQLQGQQGAMANQANQMAGQQIAQTNQNMQAALANQQQQQNALAGYNNNMVGMQSNVNSANAGMANTRMNQQGQMVGGILQGVGAAAGMAHGGEVNLAMGGAPDYAAMASQLPQSDFGMFLTNGGPNAPQNVSTPAFDKVDNEGLSEGASSFGEGMANSLKPGQPQSSTMAAAKKGTLAEAAPMPMGGVAAAEGGLAEQGGHVKAKAESQKAVASGDDYANDKIPAKLSEGEIVLPRSVTMSKDPIAAAADFVRKTLSQRAKPKDGYSGLDGSNMVVKDEQSPEELYAEQPAQDIPQGAIPGPQAPMATPGVTEQEQELPAEEAGQPAQKAGQVVNLTGDQYMDELAKRQMDIASGAIQPKTYKDLFADKGTLGKIGTIFGLMLSGAGSGLTGQSNALLDMMNKQIENDLQAQKENKSGARNFISLEAQRRLQKAQVEQTRVGSAGEKIKNEKEAKKLEMFKRNSPDGDTVSKYNKQLEDIDNDLYGGATAYMVVGNEIRRLGNMAGTPQGKALGEQIGAIADEQAVNYAKQKNAGKKIVENERNKAVGFSGPVDQNAINGAVMGDLIDRQTASTEQAELQKAYDGWKIVDDSFKGLADLPAGGEAKGASLAGKAIGKIAGFLLSGGNPASAKAGDLGGEAVGDAAKVYLEQDRMASIQTMAVAMRDVLGMTPAQIETFLPNLFSTGKTQENAYKSLRALWEQKYKTLGANLKTAMVPINPLPKTSYKAKPPVPDKPLFIKEK